MRVVRLIAMTFAAALSANLCMAEPVRIGFPADSIDYAPAYAADKLGLFSKANVEVKLITFRGGGAAQEALSAGAADLIVYVAPAVALAVGKGAKEKIVAVIGPGHMGWNAIVRTDSPIRDIKDLAGKKVGITGKATTSDMAALWVAERAGVTIQQVPLGAGLIAGLRSGQVDAIVFSPMVTMREVMSGRARSILDLTDAMPPTLNNVYVASQDMIDRRADELRATLAAIYEGLAYLRANRDWTLNFLKQYAKSDDEKLNEFLYNHVIGTLSSDGRIERFWIENGLRLAARAWEMPDLANVVPETLYSNDFHPRGR
jgi:NitT/TauT family transport system substrate-binding protein